MAYMRLFRRRMSSEATKNSTHVTTPPPPPPPPSKSISASYKRFHDKRPHTTQFLQAMVVSLVGDSLSQLLITPDEEYQPLRTLKVMVTGSILSIPTYRWFLIMARYINHPHKVLSLAMKCVANQLCFAPFFLSSFITTGLLWQGIYNVDEIIANLKQRVPIAWMNGCMFWPNIVVLNFTLVPPHFRGLVNSGASVVWQAYLSWLTFASKSTVQHAIEEEVAFEHKVEHKMTESLHLSEAKSALLAAEKKVVDAVGTSSS
ncbi:hypothetical protein BZA70DRAFT_290067 [Myxozyma melibiosi]|uniref:Uncharacterized protein n=1 Tax=Myxozyma melibiosi TaxID=54550 RepID=A0ABR1F4H9_9ASCO